MDEKSLIFLLQVIPKFAHLKIRLIIKNGEGAIIKRKGVKDNWQ